ncbi:putative 3-oxo-5-alpha-steroid 4-dehydrogenase/steroid 5-alpha-reductase, partial [Globisporangium splendens]
MDASTLWKLLWVALSGGALVTLKSAFVQGLALTGKARVSAAIAQLPGAALLQIEIRKSWWTWFYLLGTLHNATIMLLVLFAQDNPLIQALLRVLQSAPVACESENKAPPQQTIEINRDVVMFLSMFTFHNARRFMESLLITEFGDSKMHIGGFVLGCIHYLCVALAVLSDADAANDYNDSDGSLLMRRVSISLGTILFVVATYHQALCNYLIATQKRKHHNKYVIPHGDWFDYVRCPLYSTEILLYVAFAMVTGGRNTMQYFICAWVLTNQCVSAKFNSDWYDTKFRNELKGKFPKWKLCPGVW